jgi:replicative superfamily II helicase
VSLKKYVKLQTPALDGPPEVIQYINDERLQRVLLEHQIFTLRSIQKEAIAKGLFFRKSFLVCAPSGSGKTLIGELCAIHALFNNFGKSAYLVPFKALASEKYLSFKHDYERFGIRVELSIGDQEPEEKVLEQADLIITTYEKMDSILRNFHDKQWISEITTIVIDEIHVIDESDRGPRLESLIVRLNEFLHQPQIIGLSATIANPEFFNQWLSSLGNETILIKSEVRPVPLHYQIEITRNKDSTLKKVVNDTLSQNGQVLVFVNKRKLTQSIANNLRMLVKGHLSPDELNECKKAESSLSSLRGGVPDLRKSIKHGIAFHHAGLLPRERKVVEESFRKHVLKVIITTTTLSAGINLPARVVILRDFKRYITSGHNIKNFEDLHENGDGFSYFKQFSPNEVFQMLGRAGRPGLDSIGYGIILVSDINERDFVEDHYFSSGDSTKEMVPKYNDLGSGLNTVHTLKEQVLLRVYEEENISMEQLKNFFKKTFFWFYIQDKMGDDAIPIEQLLLIEEISPKNILRLHSHPEKINTIKKRSYSIKISRFTKEGIGGYLKTDYGVYTIQFDLDRGIECSCGFENGMSDGYATNKFSFEFCDHVVAFLLYLFEIPDPNFQKHMEDVIPQCLKTQYILNYLFEKGLIIKNENGTIKCSQFGKLIIRLYLYPVSGVLIRSKLENLEIASYQEMIKEAYDILRAERRVRDYRLLHPLLEWTDEEPVDSIIQKHNIMAGVLYNLRDNLERIITFMGIIAIHLADTGSDLQDKLIRVAEMAETLKIRIHYGVREELFDLVMRLDNVARVRARILFDVGYHTSTQVQKEIPSVLHRKTGLSIKLCKKLSKTQ